MSTATKEARGNGQVATGQDSAEEAAHHANGRGDEIDELVAFAPGPVQMRKSREVSRLLSILDELETGKGGRE